MSSTTGASLRETLDTLVQRAFIVELAAVVALLVGFHAATIALSAVLDPYFLDSDTSLLLLQSVLVLAGTTALVASYASWRGYSLPVVAADRTDRQLVGVAVVATAALATLPFLDLALRMDIGVDHVTSTLADPGSVFTARSLIRIALFVPAMTLLYHGLIQGALRRVFDADSGLALIVTTLLGGYLAAPTAAAYGTFANGPWLSLWGTRAAVAILFVLALGVVVAARERVDGRAGALRWLPVMITLALAGVVLASDVGFPGGAVVMLTQTAVIGVAAYAYSASESLAVPAVVYATFAVVSSVLYVASLTAAFGA